MRIGRRHSVRAKHAMRCSDRGDAEHRHDIRLHPAHPDQNLTMYVQRIELAGWHLVEQTFSDDGADRRCSLRFACPEG